MTTVTQQGCEWLFEDAPPAHAFTPEQKTAEHRLVDQTAAQFATEKVAARNDRLETHDWTLARQFLQEAGALGLLGTDVPETYGGFPLDTVSAVIIASRFGQSGSFSVTYGSHTGLVIMPIRTFGTHAQKAHYLPRLVSGELVGAYCLSEAGSGSDALAAKTRAVRESDGSYRLTGEKLWISNGGFADLYVVFAQVDDQGFTAFLVDRTLPGVSCGREEHKMGLHGSSTTPVILNDVQVAADRVLGAAGEGHKVAFNVLNYGRFKLGASTSGGCQHALGEAARYAAARRQFGHPIASFGAIRHKLGEMVVRTYAVETMVYRTAGLMDATREDADNDRMLLSVLEEYAIEASMLKVAGSEALDYVLDENVQIHGGNGYVRDYPAERLYRDARVNRIFEGTNEINRLLIPGMLIKRGRTGRLPLANALGAVANGSPPPIPRSDDGTTDLAPQMAAVRAFKQTALGTLGLALETYGELVTDEQEVMSLAADILIDTFAAESVVLRAARAPTGGRAAPLHADVARVFVTDAAARILRAATTAAAAMADGSVLEARLAELQRQLAMRPVNTVGIRRRLADAAVEQAGYLF